MSRKNVIAQGSFGCILKSIQCQNTKKGRNRVVKMQLTEYAKRELTQYRFLYHRIPTAKLFLLELPVPCRPKRTMKNRRSIKQCNYNNINSDYDSDDEDDNNNNIDKYSFIVMQNGGKNLIDFVSAARLTTRGKLKNLYEDLEPLLHGLHKIYQIGWMHHDVKPQNILYDLRQRKAALIDLGHMVSFSAMVIDILDHELYEDAFPHWSYPPEFGNFYGFENFKQNSALNLNEYNIMLTKYIFRGNGVIAGKYKSNELQFFASALQERQPLTRAKYAEFVEKSVSTFDLFGFGCALGKIASVTLHKSKYSPPMFNLALQLLTPNVYGRLTFEETIRAYRLILEEQNPFSPSSSRTK